MTVTKEPVSVSLDWIMDTYKVRGDRTFAVGDLKFLLTDEQRREVTSPECIQAMQTKRLQANRPGEKRKAQGAIDVGWTCFAQPGKFRWYFTLFGKALSRNELYALKPTNMKKVKCHCVMYKRKGNPLLDSPLGPIIRSWIWGVECVLKMWDARHYNAMHTVCQPVTLSTGEVFDVRIPGVRDNVLFNFTLNHHTYPACEFGKPQSEAIISLHRDTQDFHAGIAATTDGIGPDPESLEGGSFHLYDGPFTQKASMKRGRDGKNIKVKVFKVKVSDPGSEAPCRQAGGADGAGHAAHNLALCLTRKPQKIHRRDTLVLHCTAKTGCHRSVGCVPPES